MFKTKSVISIWKKYWEYIMAVLIPLGIVLFNGIIRNSWPFGEYGILRGDSVIQYIYIFEELWNKVHMGNFSFFSWNALGGFDFYTNALYYTVSPTTLILLMLPKAWIENELTLFMVMRWALLSFTSVYFFMHTRFNSLKQYRKLVSLGLGLCFAMSGFVLNIISWFNWLDTIILFPILLILVEKILVDGEWKKYYIVLTIGILCNFYFAYMVCVFLVLWMILVLISQGNINKGNVLKFFGASILSGASSMVVILPSFFGVSERYSSVQDKLSTSDYVKSLILEPTEFVRRFFIFNSIDKRGAVNAFYYISIGAIVLSMLFFFININKKEKRIKVLLIFFLVVSLFVGGLNYFWHGFSIPHGIDQRYAFCFELLLLIMALDVFNNIDQIRMKNCFVMFVLEIIVFSIVFFALVEYDSPIVYVTTFFLIFIYNIVLVLYARKSITKEQIIIVYMSLCIIEICANAFYQFREYNCGKTEETEYLVEASDLTEDLDLKPGERVEYLNSGCNPGLWNDKATITGFVSYSYGKLIDLSLKLGMDAYGDAGILQTGGTPLLNLLYNIRYGVGLNETSFSDVELVQRGEKLSLYETKHILGLGYMVNNTITDWKTPYDTSFDLQNEYVKTALNDNTLRLFDTFTPSDLKCEGSLGELDVTVTKDHCASCKYISKGDLDGNIFSFTAEKDMDLYLLLRSSVEFRTEVKVDSESVYLDNKNRARLIIHVGDVQKGQAIRIVMAVPEQAGEDVYNIVQFADFQDDVFQLVYNQLSSSVYEIDNMGKDIVEGHIASDQDGIMATSIPALQGFDVFVDGKRIDYMLIGDTWIGVPLKKGYHTVVFRYKTPYAKVGIIISLLGVLGFCVLLFRKKGKK